MGNKQRGNHVRSKIESASSMMVLDHPFFATLFMGMKIESDTGTRTMKTNGEYVKYNESFVDSLSIPELIFVLCHEVMHVAMLHHLREGHRDHNKWNIAADYAINQILVKAKLRPPADARLDPIYDGMSAEEIYRLLPDDEDYENSGIGEVLPGDGIETDISQKRAEAEMMGHVVQAMMVAKKRGKLPGSMEETLKDLCQPKVDWRSVLRRFVDDAAKNDYSFTEPNRRYVMSGSYVPSVVSNEVGNLIVAIDTSASITAEMLSSFSSELQGILDSYNCILTVIQCDAKIHSVAKMRKGDAPLKRFEGRGGTNFKPVFEYYENAEETPKALIYLTDGYGSFPAKEPGIPVLWVSTSRKDFPWGEVLLLKED